MPKTLQAVEKAIRANTYLKLAVMDLTVENGTLVAAVDNTIPVRFTTRILRSIWAGPVEVYCPSALMTGTGDALSG
ncbi:MAG: hypothetical protein AAFO61_02475 [Pseudomonadota bacterium]